MRLLFTLLLAGHAFLAPRAQAQPIAHLDGSDCGTRLDGTEVCADACASFLAGRDEAEGVGIVTAWQPRSTTDARRALARLGADGVVSALSFRGRRPTGARTPVVGLAHVVALSATSHDACAIDGTGSVWCFGAPFAADGDALGTRPVRVDGLTDATAVQVSLGDRTPPTFGPGPIPAAARSACAISASRGVVCWSWLVMRARTAPTLTATSIPGTLGARDLASTDTAGRTFCALLSDGAVDCWELDRVECVDRAMRGCVVAAVAHFAHQTLPEPTASVEEACVIGATPGRHVRCLAFDATSRLVWEPIPELDGAVEIRARAGRSDTICALDAAGAMRCTYRVESCECDGSCLGEGD